MGSSYNPVGDPTTYNVVTRFGATGNGTMDDTAAIQRGIDFIDASNVDGCLFFPPGTYLIDGPFRQNPLVKNGYGIGQLQLPVRNLSTQPEISITFKGANKPAPNVNWTADTQPLSTGGAIIKSTKVGAAGTDAIISSGPPLTDTWGFDGIRANFENLIFRTYNDPKITPLGLQNIGQVTVQSCLFDTGTILSSITQPSNFGCGVFMPAVGNWTISRLIDCDFVGYYYGAQWAEHIFASDVRSWLCLYGFQSNGGPHGCRMEHLLAVGCAYSTAFFNQPTRIDGPMSLRRERTVFDGSRAWQNTSSDFADTGNLAIGVCHFVGVESNNFSPSPALKGGAANLTVYDTANFPVPAADGAVSPVASVTTQLGVITGIA